MGNTTLKEFATELKVPVELLAAQLKASGVEIQGEDDAITDQQRNQLLLHLRQKHTQPENNKRKIILVNKRKVILRNEHAQTDGSLAGTLAAIQSTTDLQVLNELLTRAMANRTIQPLIKDTNLDAVVDHVLEISADPENELMAAAILGRLAAVARGREQIVFERADEVVTEEPVSIETLADGDAKQYAAQVLTHITSTWVTEYAFREALAIDTADNARRELLSANLVRAGSIADWLSAISAHTKILREIENHETRLKRVRRILGVMSEVASTWRGEVGSEIGAHLAECMKSFFSGKLAELDQEVLFGSIDHLLSILRRVIELRFSHALDGATYDLLIQGKKQLGNGDWGRFVDRSSMIAEIRITLLESALVRARQNRQYQEVLTCLLACYTSKAQVAAAIKRHFQEARDLDPDVAKWWITAGGEFEGQRFVEHKVGNNEDGQIGALLIEVESNREAMEKVGRAVVPLLDISEPVLASTVKKAVDGYEAIAQTARRLARMRKLTKTDLKGEHLEYNPLEHEMLGGHQAGIRRVKVVRDGIKKEFAGKTKTLVKPWVEAEK